MAQDVGIQKRRGVRKRGGKGKAVGKKEERGGTEDLRKRAVSDLVKLGPFRTKKTEIKKEGNGITTTGYNRGIALMDNEYREGDIIKKNNQISSWPGHAGIER